jgi:hypothetical protein
MKIAKVKEQIGAIVTGIDPAHPINAATQANSTTLQSKTWSLWFGAKRPAQLQAAGKMFGELMEDETRRSRTTWNWRLLKQRPRIRCQQRADEDRQSGCREDPARGKEHGAWLSGGRINVNALRHGASPVVEIGWSPRRHREAYYRSHPASPGG